MNARNLMYAAVAAVAVAVLPSSARAQVACTYTATFGLGGTINGCLYGTATPIGEDADLVSNMYWFSGIPDVPNGATVGGYQNDPGITANTMFSDNCGGGDLRFIYCTSGPTNFGSPTTTGEMVFGLQVTTGTNTGYWVYTGDEARNTPPTPSGYQEYLYDIVDNNGVSTGNVLLAWEDLNSGCLATDNTLTAINESYLTPNGTNDGSNTNAKYLDSKFGSCIDLTSGGNSDNDYNDFYVELSPLGTRITVTPEPMTMSLMAFGLIGLGGAQLRRRRNNKV